MALSMSNYYIIKRKRAASVSGAAFFEYFISL